MTSQLVIDDIVDLVSCMNGHVRCDVVTLTDAGRMTVAHVRAELPSGAVFDVIRPTFRHAREELRAWLSVQGES